jgi:hypothetical protein
MNDNNFKTYLTWIIEVSMDTVMQTHADGDPAGLHFLYDNELKCK